MNGYQQSQKASMNMAILSLLFALMGTVVTTPPVAAKKKEKITSDGKLLAQYEAAKQVYKTGDYKEAKTLFDALRQEQCPPALTPYIHFYYALAAYHNGENLLAAETFYGIYLNFPLWNKQNEVRYWCAQCKFQEKRFEEALSFLALIQDKKMSKSILRMKKYFLNQIEDCACLQELVENFDDDPMLKKLLYKKAAHQAYITQDFTLVDHIKQQYNLGDYTYDPLRRLASKRKNAYRIAVFLPFYVDEFDYEKTTNEFVIDLYQGIQLAIEALAKEGITLKLFSFDTKNSAATTKALLTQEELKYMDLIIGPLDSVTIPLVASFAKQHKINFVNPISNNAAFVHGHPFAFLFQPTLETYAQKAAQVTLNDIHNKAVAEPSIAVFYGTAPEDVLQATLYKQLIEEALGRPLDWFVQLSDPMIKDFFAQADRSEQKAEEGSIMSKNEVNKENLTKITHIYLPSQHKLLVSSVVNLPFKLDTRPQIIGHEKWIEEEILTIHQLRNLPLIFLTSNYIDFSQSALTTFRSRFFEKTATFPTRYSYIGYEMMLFFGRMLATYGVYFQKEWEDIPYNGTIFRKIYYGKHHSNQHISLLRFIKNKFVVEEELG